MSISKMKIAVIGCGNIGKSIAHGILNAKIISPKNLFLTRRRVDNLAEFGKSGAKLTSDNKSAVDNCEILIIAVAPHQLNEVLEEISGNLTKKHIVISIVSGASISKISEKLPVEIPVIRSMPNTAIAIQESMTCISGGDKNALAIAMKIFESMGTALIIPEELMIPATALCACGIAFFLRAIRAASQGGIEIGFHSEEALTMAAQTAKGAAALLLSLHNHPEREVDKVTTPQGCTISGLNTMEHNGFSSALIKGIVNSAEKAAKLYS